ncbi:hypothetical protein Afil01_14390 [Actinorhabdospora filicis]|uniref:DUF3995 domain-containing protein n=1 Tax=Actinorhabdospora filicis TaxID=1785913 RepID=A0A9W6SIK8_9ACTN|nr:hypothetical protein [Actinorhabdospora filicis]GLZ76632.1 hypothetical protein Afil01_14390 [Actinorhabdospora filicis]
MKTPQAAVIAALGGLAYAASKIHFAVRGELGIDGFEATPEANAAFGDATAAQLGNAALGVITAALALALLRRWPRWVEVGLHIASWGALLLIGAGFVGFALRAAGVVSNADGMPVNGWSWVTVTLGAVWVGAWGYGLVGHWRRGRVEEESA